LLPSLYPRLLISFVLPHLNAFSQKDILATAHPYNINPIIKHLAGIGIDVLMCSMV